MLFFVASWIAINVEPTIPPSLIIKEPFFMHLFDKKPAVEVELEKRPDGRDRLPPGQYLTQKWPVLSYERTPAALPSNWKLKITGQIEHPFELNWDEFLAMPRTILTADFH